MENDANKLLSELYTFTVKFWVVLDKTALHIMVLCICEFRENRRTKGRSFVAAVTESTFMRAPWHCTSF